jgi:hypothetical protein
MISGFWEKEKATSQLVLLQEYTRWPMAFKLKSLATTPAGLIFLLQKC